MYENLVERPFKSAADLEEEERILEMERNVEINGWCSRFYGGGVKRIKIYPTVKEMQKHV